MPRALLEPPPPPCLLCSCPGPGLGVQTLVPRPGGEPTEDRLQREAEGARRRLERQHKRKLESVYRVGGGQETRDVVTASEMLLEQRLPGVAALSRGEGGSTGSHLLSRSTQDGGALSALEDQCRARREELLMVRGAKLVLGPTTGRLQKFQERECLVVSLSHHYVLGVESLDSLAEAPKALQRLTETRELLEDYFGGELREGWSFLGALTVPDLGGANICHECRDFVLGPRLGTLEGIVERLERERGPVFPSPLVYRALVRSLLLCLLARPAVEGEELVWSCHEESQAAVPASAEEPCVLTNSPDPKKPRTSEQEGPRSDRLVELLGEGEGGVSFLQESQVMDAS